MSENIPVYEGESPNSSDERLIELFDILEKGQMTFLDEAGKRVIELSSMFLGLLFAVAAFGEGFPPKYIQDQLPAKILYMLVLMLYLASLLMGFFAIRPRRYERYEYNLTRMRNELKSIQDYKEKYFWLASALFFIGSVCLVWFIGIAIFSA